MRKLVINLMAFTGFRFSKNYRWGTTLWHRIVYAMLDSTALYNLEADKLITKRYVEVQDA
jgi:hypothetical protein